MRAATGLIKQYARINEILTRRGYDLRKIAREGLNEVGYYEISLGSDGRPKPNGFGSAVKTWRTWPPHVAREIAEALDV